MHVFDLKDGLRRTDEQQSIGPDRVCYVVQKGKFVNNRAVGDPKHVETGPHRFEQVARKRRQEVE